MLVFWDWREYKIPVSTGGGVDSVEEKRPSTTSRHGIFFFTLPSFARIKRPRWRPVDMYVVTEKGNCEQLKKLTDFLLRSRKTVRFSEHIMSVVQISEHISAPNGRFVYLFRGQSCCCTRFRILRVRLHVWAKSIYAAAVYLTYINHDLEHSSTGSTGLC